MEISEYISGIDHESVLSEEARRRSDLFRADVDSLLREPQGEHMLRAFCMQNGLQGLSIEDLKMATLERYVSYDGHPRKREHFRTKLTQLIARSRSGKSSEI